MKSELTKELAVVKNFACTMDAWSSLAGEPYMTLSVHFVNDEWVLKTKCLTTMYVPASHTADTIIDFVKEGLADYNLFIDDMTTVTTDAAANNISACSKMNVKRISCVGHILHNALNNAFSSSAEITNLLKASRKIVSVFSYSHESRKKLEKLKKELKIDCKSLVQDVSTRWGSKYKMLCRLHKCNAAIDQLFVNHRKHRELLLSFEQKDLLSTLVDILQPFSTLTDLLSGDTMVTVSSIMPTLHHIQSLCECDGEEGEVAERIKNCVWDYFSQRFINRELNMYYGSATMLDRRYEYESCIPDIIQWPTKDEVKDFLCRISVPGDTTNESPASEPSG
jgi:hypothetical protein